MGCGEGCSRFCSCCCSCLSRIPYGTAVGIVVSLVGLIMFLAGLMMSLKEINNMIYIKGSLDFGNKVAGVVLGVGIVLGILVLLFACCTSGSTRANVYSGVKSKLCGKCFSSILMIVEYILYLAMALLTALLMVPLLLQIILNAVCKITPKCLNLNNLGLGDIITTINRKASNGTMIPSEICSDELKSFCKSVSNTGTPMLITVIGSFIAALGTVHILMCLSANFAYVNSFHKQNKNKNNAHVEMN